MHRRGARSGTSSHRDIQTRLEHFLGISPKPVISAAPRPRVVASVTLPEGGRPPDERLGDRWRSAVGQRHRHSRLVMKADQTALCAPIPPIPTVQGTHLSNKSCARGTRQSGWPMNPPCPKPPKPPPRWCLACGKHLQISRTHCKRRSITMTHGLPTTAHE